MAEEEVVAVGVASPSPLDHKRKYEELEPEVPESAEPGRLATTDLNVEPEEADDVVLVSSDETDAKRPRVDDKFEAAVNENGHQGENDETQLPCKDTQPVSEEVETVTIEKLIVNDERPAMNDDQSTINDGQPAVNDGQPAGNDELLVVNDKQPAEDNSEAGDTDTQHPSLENLLAEQSHEPSKEETQPSFMEAEDQREVFSEDQEPTSGIPSQSMTRTMEVPNNKVGVLIGKSGDTIRYMQHNSGAKIQIMRDGEADEYSTSRPIQIIGNLENIEKAEKLINAVLAEADAGGSPSLVARGLAPSQVASAAEQIHLQVPNEKVGLIIGRGGETIKSLQTRSGARVQLIPQVLPEGEECKERTVRVTGDKMQIEIATEMIKEVMSQTVRGRPSHHSSGFNQQGRSRGSGAPTQWGPRGPHRSQPTAYDYPQRGPYPSSNPQYSHHAYRNYPQVGSRSNFAPGLDPRPQPSMQGPPSHGAYDYYGGRGHTSNGPVHGQHPNPVHASGPGPGMGTPQVQPNYGHHGQYSQATPQQSYGQGYNEHKYGNHAPVQNPYGGHGGSQAAAYPQAGSHAGYFGQQQASYGMPSQGQPQSYAAPRASQPGEMPYQGPTTGQSYGPNAQPQQTYPYTSGSAQQMYPQYGSAPASDGYSQAAPVASASYPQPGYGQPVAQQAPGYSQMGGAGGYVQYPSSQPAYPEQPAPNSAASYGYQGPQDQGYTGAAAAATATATYSAAPSGQPGYSQQTPAQPSYDQTAPPSGGYGSAPTGAPAAYGKTVSPQPTGYAQYDSTQVYAAPR